MNVIHIQFPTFTRFVALTNIPPHWDWLDTMRFLRLGFNNIGTEGVRKIIRTFEANQPIIWISCSSTHHAISIRGIFHDNWGAYPPVMVYFVSGDVWSARNSWTKTFWTRKTGLVLGPHDEPVPGITIRGDFLETSDGNDEKHLEAAITSDWYTGNWVVPHSKASLSERLDTTMPPEGAVRPVRLRNFTRRRGRKHRPLSPTRNSNHQNSTPAESQD